MITGAKVVTPRGTGFIAGRSGVFGWWLVLLDGEICVWSFHQSRVWEVS